MLTYPRLSIAASCLLFAFLRASAAPVINEIMFHPLGSPAEDPAKEWIEIYNPSTTTSVDVSGWKLSKGVSFTIPPATILPPAGYLVIAASIAVFEAANPGFEGQLLGGWTGQLAGSGEQIQLDDAAGVKVNDVTYADEGDWALRGRGVLSFSHRGWSWFNDADGLGKTLELRNPMLGNGSGQNWGVSMVVGGSPGGVNSVATLNVAPLIKDVKHRPEIPRTTDPIVVSCNLENEAAGATATLRWRLDGAGTFNTLAMSDTDGDGDVEATIPAQPVNLSVVEWYIFATDGTLTRTWPAPARTSDPGVLPETFGQVTNALLLVDDSFSPTAEFRTAGNQPTYRLILTAAERGELVQIGTTSGQQESLATFNATFISHDGTGVKVVLNAGVRNRGGGDTALGPPNNYSVSFRSDDRWNGRGGITINAYYPHSQVLGNTLFTRAGIATQEAAVVRVRLNGVDMAETGARMYSRYARLEGRNSEWAERHYPNDSAGNFYRLDDHAYPQNDPRSGELAWEGPLVASYSDTFIKETNQDAADYSDIIELARVISAPATGGTVEQPAIPDSAYVAALSARLDLDHFFRFLATDALIGNQEGGLQSGRADDVSMYRGTIDTRFRFVPHDMDAVFNLGTFAGNPLTRSLFSYVGQAPTSGATGVDGFARLLSHPQLVPRYYAAVLDGLETWFNHATIDPIIDQIMFPWVAPATITAVKGYIDTRRANVLTQIPQGVLVLANNPAVYTLNVTTGAAAVGGYPTTTDGSATFGGTFNVAKTYSITVNGQLAQWFYRPAGADAAGSWKLAVPTGGGSVLKRGLNRVVVNFWDGVGGTGNVVQSLTADVFYNVTGTSVTGTLTAGSMRLTAPSSYIPGKPFLARVELLDAAGNLDRTAWDTTVTLSSNVAGITLPNVQLYNGQGSALITAGGGGGLPPTILLSYGTLGNGTAGSGVAGSQWKSKSDFNDTTLANFIATIGNTWRNEGFNDTAWTTVFTQAGYGNNDENTPIPDLDYLPASPGTSENVPCYLFRTTFTIADVNALASVTGNIKYDDAYAIYVNGQDILQRSAGLPAGRDLSLYATAPSADNATAGVTIPLSFLHNGVNTIAVDVRQANSTSGDVTFDMQLQANYPSANPGNFTLTANGGGFSAQKAITSLTATPTITTATTPIAANTTWSGVVRVTGNVTVNAGATLTVAAGTHVLFDGNATAGSTTGTGLIVNGALVTQGTQANPVNISPFLAGDKWGQISFVSAQPSALNHTLLHGAGHSPTAGHASKGPMIRMSNSSVSLLDTVLADGPAKAVYTENFGVSALVIQRSLIERMITGPELEQNCSLLIEDSNIQRILPDYRESNSLPANDEDCLYVHNPTSLSVIVRRSVFARCGDDVFDGLGGPLIVEKCILREGWDKGMSLLNNDLTITDTQIIRCDKGIVPKSNSATPTRVITVDRCTIICENHDSSIAPWGYTGGVSGGDPDTVSTGLYTQNKSGQSDPDATLAITAKNTIIQAQAPVLIDAPYSAANTVVTYSDLILDTGAAFAWPGTGNIGADPLFVAAGSADFHLTAASPARDTGEPAPATPLDPDGSRADMGALQYTGSVAAGGTITWTPAGGPYRVTGDTTVPVGTTLVINAGTSVLFDLNRKMTVNGVIKVLGTDGARVVFSNVPGTTGTDPITGIAGQPAKWAGLVVVGPAAAVGPAITGSEFRYCTFLNAQPAVSAGNTGSLGIIRAFALVDHCIFLGTRLRQLYGENCALQVQYCTFVDPFDPANNADNPVAYALDNIAEPLKVANGNIVSPNYVFGLPVGGYFRVWYNEFRGNKGHNDVFDADSGGFDTGVGVGVNSTNPILDCRYNNFLGFSGDEHIDLGGDAYVASNIFQRAHKDVWTNDHGYSNCISSGDKTGQTTIWVARNIAFNVDHVINCKNATATIFEHNTVANFYADFFYSGTGFTQDVKNSAINQYVPDDDSPSRGAGAYVSKNIFHNIPRVITWADLPATSATKLEAANNYLFNVTDNSVGPVTAQFAGGTLHPGGFTALGAFVQPGDPQFVDEAGKNYALKMGSPARGTAPGGIDYGATVAEWAHILNGPSGTTDQTSASFTITGPAVVAYKWRLDGGPWSTMQQIGGGLIFTRGAGATPTVREATLTFNGLAPGPHTLEVVGRDPAGNWQDTDLARIGAGLPALPPTVRTWTVDTVAPVVRITEVLAESATLADTIELQNQGSATVNLGGWTLTDDPLVPAKYTIPANTMLAAGAFITFTSTTTAISLDRNGDAVYLRNGATLVDSIAFGNQIADLTIGRSPVTGAWTLCTPTLGAANLTRQLGDPTVARISEWFTSGDVLYDADWIELRNASALPVDLSGMRLTDNRAGDPLAHTFAPLTFIPANGYARFIADGATSQGPSHLGFSLDAEQENISLSSAAGALLDTITFFPQTTDYSMGRDALGNYVFYELPTREFLNGTGDPAYTNALAILRGLRISEIMFNAIGGSDFDYIELTNTGATPLALAGVSFVQGVTFTFPAMTLNPGEYVIVVKNLSRFRSRYGNAPVVAGTFTGQLDNGGETIGLQLPPPFDANALTFAYSDAWYPPTDGFGPSIYVPNPLLRAGVWGDRGTWATSLVNGGDPGGVLATLLTYSGFSARNAVQTVLEDIDRDSIGALMEFSLGQDITNPNGGNGVAGLPLLSRAGDGRATLSFLVPENAAAVQNHGYADLTYRVQAADILGTWTTIATKTYTTAWSASGTVNVGAASGGYVPVTIGDLAPLAVPPRWLRLQMSWTP